MWHEDYQTTKFSILSCRIQSVYQWSYNNKHKLSSQFPFQKVLNTILSIAVNIFKEVWDQARNVYQFVIKFFYNTTHVEATRLVWKSFKKPSADVLVTFCINPILLIPETATRSNWSRNGKTNILPTFQVIFTCWV